MRQPYDFFLPSEEEISVMNRLVWIVLFISIKTKGQQLTIPFESGSFIVSSSSVESINVFVKKYQDCQFRFAIQGRTDDVGTDADNLELSRKRAEAVLDLIVSIGKDKSLISIDWLGESEPLADNKDAQGRGINRSVTITCMERICETVAKDDIEDLYQQLKDVGQRFCIDPSKDTAIVGNNGSIVYYKPGTFKGTHCSCITLVLHEFYQPSSMILNNLTTTSSGRTLESGGMIKLEGFCGTDTLEYQTGRSLTVFIPADSTLPGMKLFTANRRQQKEILDWKSGSNSLETVDARNLGFWCRFRNSYDPVDCHLFFCKIVRMLTFKSRDEQRANRLNQAIEKEVALVRKYGLDADQLEAALQKSKTAGRNVLKYYVYGNADWGYCNLDRFKGEGAVEYLVKEQYNTDTDVKMIIQAGKIILPSVGRQSYRFNNIPGAQGIWLFGLRYRKGKAYLAMEQSNTSVGKCSLNFKEETIESIRTALQRID